MKGISYPRTQSASQTCGENQHFVFVERLEVLIKPFRALNHDPDVYGPDAAEFRPDRHLNEAGHLKAAVPDTKDESHVSFGFGRR